MQHAKYVRPALWTKISKPRIDEDLKAVWEQTLAEAGEAAWLDGPHDWQALSDKFGKDWLFGAGLVCGSARN